MEQLLQFDTNLLLVINSWHNAFCDNFFWHISDKRTWIPLYIVLVACLIKRYGKQSIWFLLAFGACVGLADFIASGILKETVMRLRPTHEPTLEGILHVVNNYRSGLYGFVSSHAANTIGICLLFSLIWHDWRATLPLTFFTILNCYSRMYLGVHYPGDILGGLIVGTLVAIGLYTLMHKPACIRMYLKKDEHNVSPYYHWSILLTFVATIVACAWV